MRYVIVGAFAVAYHGYLGYTSDIDLFVASSPENTKQLLRAMEQFGFADFNLSAEDFSGDQIVELGVAPNRIDLLTALSGVTFDEVWRSRECSELDGVRVNFISREMLKRNKKACGRLKDLADLEYL